MIERSLFQFSAALWYNLMSFSSVFWFYGSQLYFFCCSSQLSEKISKNPACTLVVYNQTTHSKCQTCVHQATEDRLC